MISLRRLPFKQTLSEPFWGSWEWQVDRKGFRWSQWTLNMPQVTTQIKSDWEYQMLTLCLVATWWAQLCTAVKSPGYGRCLLCAKSILQVSSWLACLKVNLLSSYYAKQFLLSALAPFHPLNVGLDNTFNRKIKLFFWKLHFSDYLCTSLPPFPTNGSTSLAWSPGPLS